MSAGRGVAQRAAAAAGGALPGSLRLHVHPAGGGGGRQRAQRQPPPPARTRQLLPSLVHIPPSGLSVVVFNSAGHHVVFSTLSLRVQSSSRSPIKCVISRRFSYGTREKVLRWLFPKAELCPLLDSAGTIVQRCLVTHSTNSQSKVSSPESAQSETDRPQGCV